MMHSNAFGTDVLEVGTVEKKLKARTMYVLSDAIYSMFLGINYLITIYSTCLNTIVDGFHFIEKRELFRPIVGEVKY